MRIAAFLLLAPVACGEAEKPPAPGSNAIEAQSAAAVENAAEPAPAAAMPKAEAPAQPPEDYPGVAALSPSQRRAYERGYRDCRAGRYEPGDWAEAYRIGCAAAQEAG